LCSLLALGSAANAPPTSDQLYGILTIVGGENTETIVQTVSIDLSSGNVNTLVTNFIYAGSSLTYDGISTLDDKKENLYYATDAASAFIYSANVRENKLNPPIDVGAVSILDLKMDTQSSTLYIEFADADNSVLIATYSTNGGPATLLANLTDVLLSEGGEIGQSTLDTTNNIWYFISYTSSGELINTVSLTNLTATSSPLSTACQKAFSFLFFDSSSNQLYGILELIRSGKVHYSFATLSPSGECTESAITHEPYGIITAFSYSPYSNNVYYGLAGDSGNDICSIAVPLTGLPNCTSVLAVVSDLEVAYPK